MSRTFWAAGFEEICRSLILCCLQTHYLACYMPITLIHLFKVTTESSLICISDSVFEWSLADHDVMITATLVPLLLKGTSNPWWNKNQMNSNVWMFESNPSENNVVMVPYVKPLENSYPTILYYTVFSSDRPAAVSTAVFKLGIESALSLWSLLLFITVTLACNLNSL